MFGPMALVGALLCAQLNVARPTAVLQQVMAQAPVDEFGSPPPPAPVAPPPAALVPPPRQWQQTPAVEMEEGVFNGSRLAVSFGAAAVGAALAVGSMMFAVYGCNTGTSAQRTSCSVTFGFFSIPGIFLLPQLGAYIATRAMGGKGSFGSAVGGAAAAVGAASTGTLLVGTGIGGLGEGAVAPILIGTGVATAFFSALFIELSHVWSGPYPKQPPRAALVPVQGGAVFTLGGAF